MKERKALTTEQPFSKIEIQQRLATTRKLMQDVHVDMLIVTDPNDVYYLTGAWELKGLIQMALVVPLGGEMAFAGREVDALAYVAHTGRENVFSYRDHESPATAISRAIESYGQKEPRIGHQPGSSTLSVVLFGRLQDALPQASWVDTTRLIWDQSAIKSEQELVYMCQAAAINTKALDRAIAAITPGVSDNRVAAELITGMLQAGSHPMPSFQLATGPRTSVAHATYNDRRLETDDLVHFEFSAARFRYVAPLMRTAALGRVSPLVQHLYDGAMASLEAALNIIREGATSAEVDAAANRALDRYGVREYHYHRTGYMVGIAGYTWALGHIGSLREGDPMVLKENMTFHLPMILFKAGVAGAGIGETIRVTKNGLEVLTSYRHELIKV